MNISRLHERDTAAARGREFWRDVLLDRSFAALPRWARDPRPGVDQYETVVPEALVAALRDLAKELALPFGSLLLSAHAKVLGVLCGERTVTLGYAAGARAPLPLHIDLAPGTWRDTLRSAARATANLQAYRDFPVDELGRELGIGAPLFETVFEPLPDDSDEPADGIVLRVGFAQGERLVLRLRYRTDVLDDQFAARIAGYHLRALALIAADPDAEHAKQSLLSAQELRLQLYGLGGPPRRLPKGGVHELFEGQVRAHPNSIAVMHGERQLTYRQLNARANRLARMLRAHGLQREGVVAVVTERNLDWISAVLAIFKAGGVYLPIAPHFPTWRIARTLARADCRLAVVERGTHTMFGRALAARGIQRLFIDNAQVEGFPATDLGLAVAPDQLAYISFSSGSTGEPKAAMCEHAGMLNHLFAKIDDLQIDSDSVVAQTAPQGFDISLWQLLCALLVGGRTLLIDQQAILDAERFVDTIVDGRVNVLQVVPSFLDAILSWLERHPCELPDLRHVAVTGEPLKKELTRRWFAAQPGIRLVNGYGLIGTSLDTHHEVLDEVPSHERVPLGRPVNNTHVYVVDEQLSPVPLGAPGEIVFSGICVGRGYIDDPERTQRDFLDDPHKPGQRLHRSGDCGRWLPDGKLELLGRLDSQIKIRGFRIALGEIENRLSGLSGIRDGAVVVAERPDRRKRLVAFYSAEHPLDAAALQTQLGESLPRHMLPAAMHWRRRLPLTGNGKIDRKALRRLAEELENASQDRPAEQHRAGVWPAVLGMAPIDRQTHSFDLSDTALAAQRRTAAEAEPLGGLSSSPEDEDTAACWTRQEACLKARGVGPAGSLSGHPAVHASDAGQAPVDLRVAADADAPISCWSLDTLKSAPGYSAAPTTGRSERRLRHRRWSDSAPT